MNTATSVDNSNDCLYSMSPALTHDHQDVVTQHPPDELVDSKYIPCKIKDLKSKSDCPKTHGVCNGNQNYDEENHSLLETIPPNHEQITTKQNVTKSCSDNCLDDCSPQELASHRSKDMTHGEDNKLFANSISSLEKDAASKSGNVTHEVNGKPTDTVNGIESLESDSKNRTMDIPSVSALMEHHEQLMELCKLLVSRIKHLQAMVATRHTKQQMMILVEHYHKCLNEQNELHNNLNQSSNGMSSVLYSRPTTNQELSNMPTSALVDLVQRMQTQGKMQNKRNNFVHQQTPFKMTVKDKTQVQQATGVLSKNLRHLYDGIDSDATESSSGGETDDDDTFTTVDTTSNVRGTNKLRSKACWRWTRSRAKVISRWTWLQAQVSDLEYKIRQHGELHKQLRTNKQPVLSSFTTAQNGDDNSQRAARCIPFVAKDPKRHSVIRLSSAPSLSNKGRKMAMVHCQCVQTVRQCAICAGHHNYFKPTEIHTLSKAERISQVDMNFHPVLSFPKDVAPGIELEQIVNSTDNKHSYVSSKKLLKLNKNSQNSSKRKLYCGNDVNDNIRTLKKKKVQRLKLKQSRSVHDVQQIGGSQVQRKKRKYNKKNRNPAIRSRCNSAPQYNGVEDDDYDDCLSMSAPVNDMGRPANKRPAQTFDIDDIVIPYHIAASTRVEKLQYKEIDTPRWREYVINGAPIHNHVRSSTSIPSLPVTPMPDADSSLNVSQTSADVGLPPATPQSVDSSSIQSSQSSSHSLMDLECEEEISDDKYIERHKKQEEKEKQRYMNFVTTSRRSRINSAVVALPGDSATNPDLTNSRPLTQATSFPLSASHEASQLKDELNSGQRKRSNSFAVTRIKKDPSVDVAEEHQAQPWPLRTFPLSGDDEAALDPNWKSIKAQPVETQDSMSEKWKVVTPVEEPHKERQPLVLKLSKA